jgi:hypothetical protein
MELGPLGKKGVDGMLNQPSYLNHPSSYLFIEIKTWGVLGLANLHIFL